MWHSVVGSYPVQQFLDDFLPLPDGIYRSSIPSCDFSGVSTTKQEAKSYDSLVNAINSSKACPGFEMRNSSSCKQHSSSYQPDLAFCKVRTQEGIERPIDEVIFEMKTEQDDTCHDADSLYSSSSEKSTASSVANHGKIWTYLAHQMSAHPRLFVFCVFIYGDRARFLRVDRSGGSMTTSFCYEEEDFLAQFLYRYSHATNAQRGWDPTATFASVAETRKLSRALHKYKTRLEPRNVDYLDPTLDSRSRRTRSRLTRKR
ncbi:hypothetical protein QCA50_010831 [Cerrena zonata]|uniref:Fungal-type protein kinase domain-containing protein n=1 Tax=Cerrena zonata TaxID=2478898 RepID=A0AAW0GAD0_9APHY